MNEIKINECWINQIGKRVALAKTARQNANWALEPTALQKKFKGQCFPKGQKLKLVMGLMALWLLGGQKDS
jgi:hypothetical protein